MLKREAIEIFGQGVHTQAEKIARLAAALGVKRHAIYMMPDVLPQATTDRVIGAAMRFGIDVSDHIEHQAWEAA